MSIIKDRSRRIVPETLVAEKKSQRSVEECKRSISITKTDIRIVYTHLVVFFLEDMPFGILNLLYFLEVIEKGYKQDPYMLFSIIFSVGVGAFKLAKIVKLAKLWEDLEYYKNLLVEVQGFEKERKGADEDSDIDESKTPETTADGSSSDKNDSSSVNPTPSSSATPNSLSVDNPAAVAKCTIHILNMQDFAIEYANTIDDVLYLLGLAKYKANVIAMGGGETLAEIASAGFDKLRIHNMLEGIKKSEAYCLAFTLRRINERMCRIDRAIELSSTIDEMLQYLNLAKYQENIRAIDGGASLRELAGKKYEHAHFSHYIRDMKKCEASQLAHTLRKINERYLRVHDADNAHHD